MKHVTGENRDQTSMFPLTLEDLVQHTHPCRVIDAFVEGLPLAALGFAHAVVKRTGRPPYNPGSLLKLYLYGYLNRIRSSRCLERECHRNVEVMWLLGRLSPDHKTIANFRAHNGEALNRAAAELVRFLRQAGVVKGDWVAIDGSKFRAVASRKAVNDPKSLERTQARADKRMAEYLAQLDEADRGEQPPDFDEGKVRQALEVLNQRKCHAQERAAVLAKEGQSHEVETEPESRLMRIGPAYNLQIAVDGGSGIIVAHTLTNDATDNRQLQPMAEAAARAMGVDKLDVLADKGYSNGAQAAELEAQHILAHVPANRAVNSSGDGGLLDRSEFIYSVETDTLQCPGGATLRRKGNERKDKRVMYQAKAEDCEKCPLKPTCTTSRRRTVGRHVHDNALQRMDERATIEAMRRRRCTVEHPFGTLKMGILGHPRLLVRGLAKAAGELAIATTVWNLKRAMSILGTGRLQAQLA